ncbi:MAG: RHS repeat-associated core domain-containing protein, partial [Deltaproteobacteria bacterium]|nr:RHS repeat-associated core domain-containing protein [Deltaproteobacteria bacterium]
MTDRYFYHPFGQVLSQTGNTPNPYKFAGALGVEADATTGLYYMRARYYDPAQGRFISKDPIGMAGGINQYTYTENNPMSFSDPSGLFALPAVLIPCVAGGAAGVIGTGLWDIGKTALGSMTTLSWKPNFSGWGYVGNFAGGCVAFYAGSVGMVVGGPVGAYTVGRATSGAVSDAVTQKLNILTGVQKDPFSWKSVGLSAGANLIPVDKLIPGLGGKAKKFLTVVAGKITQREGVKEFMGTAAEEIIRSLIRSAMY